MSENKTPRVMSTQHPDNVQIPFFANKEVLAGEDEVKEAYFAFSQLGITEQMWDGEGKEVDERVIEKLISNYTDYFKENQIGKDLRVTYRVPNPSVEKEQGKILLETLQSIPRAYDVAKLLHDQAPIFEVILPMTTSVEEIDLIANYYEKIIIGQKNTVIARGKTIKDWVGDFQPEKINVIPLFETDDALLNSANIVKDYLADKHVESQRVFLARSDPALNYGSLAAVLLNKIALMNLDDLQEKTSIEILPIIGVGGLPFRGNFNPSNVTNCLAGYPSVQTFTAQSSFKYDNPIKEVTRAVDTINITKRGKAIQLDANNAKEIITKVKTKYQKQLTTLVPHVNKIASKLPERRARKLHTGLFGYSRKMNGTQLPRAIKFTGALYSIGLPPEILGLSALNANELDSVRSMYKNLDLDLQTALQYYNEKALALLPETEKEEIKNTLANFTINTNEEYQQATTNALNALLKSDDSKLNESIKHTAWIRKSIG